ncbi:hypothetical protein D0469_07210 [Peribacillus saganii]|uniref:Uncharacterized protein n=1 Tax=Peribacillus saganii TaxID=2303992 RepID=A0A372LRH2_9BACI|nr:hypothetical protein [Peribacillus saganii]RFU70382.1 hypothetical protein D0469_07210 [Peribacillus saganii]
MAAVKSVKIDGKEIRIFNSAIYIVESNTRYTLELDIIVSEVAERKYGREENLIIEIELQDGRMINSIMHVQQVAGELPKLNLYCNLDEIDEYPDFQLLTENDIEFPNIEKGITLAEIRQFEMPNENIRFKLTLPIDQAEWLKNLKQKELNQFFKEAIYEYWKNQTIK